ncbi:MAG: trypsin-like peptidase domain-containing protein [Clostridia bacterium]|nr:trypsin-like peptidase domain-containing protein [Clostridia bacterium]
MKNRPISYPADYRNDPGLRGEHLRGVVFVWVLVILIIALSTVGVTLAVREAITLEESGLLDQIIEKYFPNGSGTIEIQIPSVSQTPMIVVPPTPGVDPTPRHAELPTSEPEATAAPLATVAPNPDFLDNVAQPYAEQFDNLPDAIEAVAPAVVGIVNWQTYERNGKLVEWGSGSGFLITTDGYILTNAHVIEDAERITVTLHDGTECEAALVGQDRTADTAVLKIDKTGLAALPKGDSDKIRVGETVFVIGDPVRKELAGSVTCGIISAKERSITIDGFTNTYIQTDAAINFGSSGGPLLSADGYVIGMTGAKTVTAGYDDYGNRVSAEGIGYALPINRVWEIATQLISTGKVQKPGIGITISQINAQYAEEGDELRPYVAAVTPGGPADIAGVKEGDVILGLDGTFYDTYSDIVSHIREKTVVGQTVVFTIERNGEQLEIEIVIGDLNQ